MKTRKDRVLDAWKTGKSQLQIARDLGLASSSVIAGIIRRARRDGDERAARRGSPIIRYNAQEPGSLEALIKRLPNG